MTRSESGTAGCWRCLANHVPNETRALGAFRFETRRDSKEDEPAVWTAASRVLLNMDEFLTRQ